MLCVANNSFGSVYFRNTTAGRGLVEQCNMPKCQRCHVGDLLPLSDFGSQGASIMYKAWVCTNPECGYNIKIRNGDIYINEPIMNGANNSRSRQNIAN